MKKLILISAIAATTLFGDALTDMAQKAAADHVKNEASKAVSSEVAKATGTEEKAGTETKEGNSTETSSLKEKAIDVAADQAKEKTGVDKGIAKEAIKAVVK
jgi:hypothetical protein